MPAVFRKDHGAEVLAVLRHNHSEPDPTGENLSTRHQGTAEESRMGQRLLEPGFNQLRCAGPGNRGSPQQANQGTEVHYRQCSAFQAIRERKPMHICDIFAQHRTTFSFEFTPPKTDEAAEELYRTSRS